MKSCHRPNVGRLLAAGVALTAALTPAAAHAIPLIGIGASAAGYVGAGNRGVTVGADGNAEVFGIDAAGSILTLPGQTGSLVELGLRKELSFIPMLSVKPTLAYQGQSLFQADNSFQHGLQGRLDVAFSPILSPIWFEGNYGYSYYPLANNTVINSYALGGYFAFLPLASVGLRYRSFNPLSGAGLNTVELGLRVTI
ncbi:MAG TPA: hypothetical protein V6D05_05410 [Stenomitos sp.]